MNRIGKAETLSELKKMIDIAIKEYGEDAIWWGWDDGCIIIDDDAYIESTFGEE